MSQPFSVGPQKRGWKHVRNLGFWISEKRLKRQQTQVRKSRQKRGMNELFNHLRSFLRNRGKIAAGWMAGSSLQSLLWHLCSPCPSPRSWACRLRPWLALQPVVPASVTVLVIWIIWWWHTTPNDLCIRVSILSTTRAINMHQETWLHMTRASGAGVGWGLGGHL